MNVHFQHYNERFSRKSEVLNIFIENSWMESHLDMWEMSTKY